MSLETLVARLLLPEKLLQADLGKTFPLKEVIYFSSGEGKVTAHAEGGLTYTLATNLNALERDLGGLFLRVNRSFMVDLNRITGVSERYPEAESESETIRLIRAGEDLDECELHLSGTEEKIPVTSTYSQKVKKALDVESLHHLVPENFEDKKLRLLELIDFGWRELYSLDPKNAPEVEKFKEKWDIRQFSRERMLTCFRMFGVNQINKRRVIKNIIWQLYRWIKKGIEPQSDGNIRSLWYKVKAILSYHSNILEPGDVDTFYTSLQEMVEDLGLFRYKDFGFLDMSSPYRELGTRRPEVLLASEKLGHYVFIKKLALENGTSFLCMKGEPATITMEYLGDDLREKIGDREITIFCISDVDPAGYSIHNNLVEGLRRQGLNIGRAIKLVDPTCFTDEEIAIVRYPVVTFEEKGGITTPTPPSTMSQVTRVRDWLSSLNNDPRLYSERPLPNGGKMVTLWGIESDAADRDLVKRRFMEELGK